MSALRLKSESDNDHQAKINYSENQHIVSGQSALIRLTGEQSTTILKFTALKRAMISGRSSVSESEY